jgi:DNA mismatch repair protein MutS2
MPFKTGDRVHLAGIGSGPVVEVRSGDRYAIDIKGRIVVAAGRELDAADVTPKPAQQSRHEHAPARKRETNGQRTPTIDLHGKSIAEARDIIETFVNEALLSGAGEVRIVHGRSGGKIKIAVHQYLRALTTVASFRLDPRNPGVTIVTFA